MRSRPDLPSIYSDYYLGFHRLSRSRPTALDGICAIEVQAIFSYMDGLQMRNLDDREAFLDLIQEMDETFRDVITKRLEAKKKANTNGSGGARHRHSKPKGRTVGP